MALSFTLSFSPARNPNGVAVFEAQNSWIGTLQEATVAIADYEPSQYANRVTKVASEAAETAKRIS